MAAQFGKPHPVAAQVAMTLAFFDFGFSEMLLVGVVALLVFGGNLPDVMRNLGRSYAKLRASLRDYAQPVRDEIRRATHIPRPPKGTLSVDKDRPAPEAAPYDAGEDEPETDQGPPTIWPPPKKDEPLDEPPPV